MCKPVAVALPPTSCKNSDRASRRALKGAARRGSPRARRACKPRRSIVKTKNRRQHQKSNKRTETELLTKEDAVVGTLWKGSRQRLVDGVANALQCMASKTTRRLSSKKTCFDSSSVPQLGVREYLERLQRYVLCSEEAFILSLVYVDRLVQRRSHVAVTGLSAHRLALTSLVVALKFQDDAFYTNSYYAKIGGVSLEELNYLEIEFIKSLDWKLTVDPVEYDTYHDEVLRLSRASV